MSEADPPDTCGRCGENLAIGYLKDGGKQERVCPNCEPDHPFSVGIRKSDAERDPHVVDKVSIVIYGRDVPALKVRDAVAKLVHETFNPDWPIDVQVEPRREPDDLP